jgi:hypothetical protein
MSGAGFIAHMALSFVSRWVYRRLLPCARTPRDRVPRKQNRRPGGRRANESGLFGRWTGGTFRHRLITSARVYPPWKQQRRPSGRLTTKPAGCLSPSLARYMRGLYERKATLAPRCLSARERRLQKPPRSLPCGCASAREHPTTVSDTNSPARPTPIRVGRLVCLEISSASRSPS